MKKSKKFKAVTMAAAALLAGGVVFASSSIESKALSVDNGDHKFKKSWEDRYDTENSILIYGFNTDCLDEDYAWAYHSKKKHTGYIKNGNGQHFGPQGEAHEWSKIEVMHKSKSNGKVTYGNSF